MELLKGIVIKSTGSRYRVLDESGNIHECVLRGRFRVSGVRTTNPVAVGDRVTFDPAESLIKTISPRRNYIIRKASNLSRESQVIAANIDQALLLVTVRMPATPVEFIDRFLATAEAYRIPVILLINKTDLYGDEEMEQALRIKTVYEEIGYRVMLISATEDEDLGELEGLLRDRTTLLSGNSGVGKSTLLNRLNPSLSLRTASISEYHEQGRHITTFPEMHPLPDGGYVIDTPGIRGFGVIDFDRREIYHFFPEIFRIARECRFHNCLHLDEPGCAVREAVAGDRIELWRYKSYLSMLLEDNEKYR
ncbi:MAG: ribosome small subunit-dependent GTPase A [Bacteroidales bacterium]|jgi:ribosome biogenesis GTPase|nr:ribosome small subunit-dependent GTPase A [Bacteroidales bacterium]